MVVSDYCVTNKSMYSSAYTLHRRIAVKTYINGIMAGLAATIVLSVLMIIKAKMGVMPDVNVIAMLAHQMNGGPAIGWLAHFMIGALFYGVIYSAVFSKLPLPNSAARGAALGVAGWVVMMIAVMPMMGAGVFGLGLPSGMLVPIVTLMLHLIYGVVLGSVYRRL
jgi:uncharacterized membrane protein YagU involved in acid resistance